MTGGPPNAANTWNLNHPVDSNILILTGEIRFLPRLSLDISYGFGGIKEATITDTDYDANGVISDLSYSTSGNA